MKNQGAIVASLAFGAFLLTVRQMGEEQTENGFKWGSGSKKRMQGLRPELVRVLERFIQITDQDATITSGLRTRAEQAELVKKGASTTHNSKHLDGRAVDVVPYINGKAEYQNWDYFYPMAETMKKAAELEGVPIRWGGDWESFKDGAHFELDERYFPQNVDLIS